MAVFRVPLPFDDFEKETRPVFGLAGFRTSLTRVFTGSVSKSPRVEEVAELMGLSLEDVVMPVHVETEIEVEPGDVVYVTGESGGGKSLLVKHLAAEMSRVEEFSPVATSWQMAAKIDREKALVDCVGADVRNAVEVLSAAGLSDVFTWFRRFDELSDGQRMRFVFAKALDSGAKTVVLDEFCSSLDRETAKATAYTIQKLARKRKITCVVATAVNDLLEDLNPNLHVVKHLGPRIEARRMVYRPKPCSLLEKIKVEEGSVDDWRILSFLHYRSHRVGGVAKVFRAVLEGRVVGVVVYSTPFLKPAGFTRFFDHDWYLNERFGNLLRIQRVVIHPSFRGIGVARKLLAESMPLLGVAFVEILSSMERLVPFTHGLMRSTVVDVSPEKKKAVEEFSRLFGVDVRRHGVEEILHYVEQRKMNGQLRRWLRRNFHRFGEPGLLGEDPVKMLRVIKSSASAKVYGVWINPDKKFEEIVSRALLRP